MNRSHFQKLSRLKIKEAKLLLKHRYFDGAYFLLGYSVECAFKACIARQTKRYDFPPEKDAFYKIYSHHLESLVGAAGLGTEHQAELQRNSAFKDNWNIVREWRSEVRYKLGKTQPEVRDFFSAVLDDPNGVWLWLSKYW
jgi:hypothetical protein